MLRTQTLTSFGFFLLLVASYCTAATNTTCTPLPSDVPINQEAGRGGPLIVNLGLESGEELPFMLDTGAPVTTIDKSLEPKLGKRFGTTNILSLSDKQSCGIYAAPKLYLNGTPLLIASNIITRNSSRPNFRIMGILGMDCLGHYCLQLDFEAGKLRFLDPERTDSPDLGQPFPIAFWAGYPIIHRPGFVGARTNVMIDVGCNIDGLIPARDIKAFAVLASERQWSGQTYTNLLVAAVDHVNVLGLRFLARHLVTLNFPKRVMFLKPVRPGPLPEDRSLTSSRLGDLQSPVQYLECLRNRNQLPGCFPYEPCDIYFEARSPASSKPLRSLTLEFRRTGDSTRFYCKLQRKSETTPWTLKKCWETEPRP
ncbi:MAG: hypothetical protein C5B50_16085 [Verrucomicrobia bacterium]|nr:MAG: hypothetical protein C5B50_16085 [Verrucomicrobiota bacterium]